MKFFIIFILLIQKYSFSMPNPASVNCIKIGGKLDKQGFCKKNNKKCEEWKLFRGECKLD